MRTLRLILVIATALATPMVLSGCDGSGKPAPSASSKPLVEFSTAEICIGTITRIRREDARCTEGLNIFRWVYVTDAPGRDPELPAVGEVLAERRGTAAFPSREPSMGRVPREGARFKGP